VVPFHTKACNNVACKSLQSVPNGKIVTIRSNGKKFLGCTGYSGSNRLGHKNDSLPTLQNWSRVETWVRVNWYVRLCVSSIRGGGGVRMLEYTLCVF